MFNKNDNKKENRKIENKKNKGKIKKKTNKQTNSIHTKRLPIFMLIGLMILAILTIGIYYLFLNFKEIAIIDYEGYAISGRKITETLLGNSENSEEENNNQKKDNTNNILLTKVYEQDKLYKKVNDYFVGENKKEKINLNYPIYINDNTALYNLSKDIKLITNKFEEISGYPNLTVSNGIVYNESDLERSDEKEYIFLKNESDIFTNLKAIKIQTVANEYVIPVNSNIYFDKEEIRYYEIKEDILRYKEIKDIDPQTKVIIGEKEVSYDELLTALKLTKAENQVSNKEEIIKEDTTKENEKKQEENKEEGQLEQQAEPEKNAEELKPGAYVKPEVTCTNFKAKVYTASTELTIKDPSGKILEPVTFIFRRNGRIYLRKTYTSSGNIEVKGLSPNTTYEIEGTFIYENEQGQKVENTFYTDTITTTGFEHLDPITLSFENGEIFSNKIQLKNLKITSDLQNEAVKGIKRLEVEVGDVIYKLTGENLRKFIKGEAIVYETAEGMKSNQKISYTIKLYDNQGNELKVENNKGETRTSKQKPSVGIRLNKQNVIEVEIGLNLNNKDKVILENYYYQITRPNEEIVKESGLKESDKSIYLKDLDPNQYYTITVYANYDLEDNKGKQENQVIGKTVFATQPLSTLGYLELNTNLTDIKTDCGTVEIGINADRTDKRLIQILEEIKIELIEIGKNEGNSTESDQKQETKERDIVEMITIANEELQSLKQGQTKTQIFQDLISNTKYQLNITSKVKQGETIEAVEVTYSLKDFVTLKMPAEVQMKNLFVTGNLIDFDVRVEDIDHAVLTNQVRMELRDEKTNLILLEEISTNEEYIRKTVEKVETGKTYTLSFYADQYNEGNTDETYKANYLLKELKIVTETGITGRIGLTDLTRKGNGKNLVDVESEIKWFAPVFNTNYQAYYEKTYQKETGILTLAGGNIYLADQQYFYNLKDYVGQKVTISFKVRKKKNSGELIFAFKEGRNGKLQEIAIQEEEWSTFSKTVSVSSDGYLGFLVRRNSKVGDNRTPYVEIKELQIELGETKTTYEPYQYELEANLLINLEDKKGEIPDGTYYIRKYQNEQFIEEKEYSDMDANNQVMNKIETYSVAENVTYRFELIVRINEREYILDSQEFESKRGKEIKGIRTEEDFLQIQPKGNYILLNDLEIVVSGGSHKFGSNQIPFDGELDGNGYSISRSSSGVNNGNNGIFYVIGSEGKIHDIVWNIRMDNTVEYTNYIGIFERNYGTIENIVLNLIESTAVSNRDVSLLGQQNRGVINNFAIHLKEPLYGARKLSAAVRDNYGTLKNGYIYGEKIKATFPMLETENKDVGGLCIFNYGTIQNIYGLVNIELNEENRKKETANLVYSNAASGSVKNVYSVGVGNTMNLDKGPTISLNSGLTSSVYYFTESIFSNTYNWKTTMLALQDKEFQNQILNAEGAFEVEDLLKQNYFPQLKLPSNMPKQDYIPLPEVEDRDLADILSITVLEQGTNRLTARISVNNPSGETITGIKVKDLTCNIISQEYKDGKSSVEIELTNPIKYVSSYSVLSITTKGAYNIPYTRKFEEGERRIEVSLFREIYTIADWKEINNSPTENYQLMSDLNFINETKGFNISKPFSGILNGAGHKIYNIRIDRTLNQGMFVEVRGEIRDLLVENFSINEISGERMALVPYLNGGVINGIHLKDVVIKVNENYISNQYIGGIVSYTSSGMIKNSSISNFRVKSNAKVSNNSVGGILATGSDVDISNCYAKDVQIEVEQSIESEGLGGIAGRLAGNTKVSYCYATGNIITSNSMVGGIAGYVGSETSVVESNYSFVNIQSDMEYIGGIVGFGAELGHVSYNLALGNVYTSKSKAKYIGRIAGDSKIVQNAYAYENQLINGSKPVEEEKIQLLSGKELLQEDVYQDKLRFGQNFDYTQLSKGILPKLKDNENTKILPNQSDLKLEEHQEFSIKNIEYEKTDAYKLAVRIELKNTKEYPVTNVIIENMNTKLVKQTHDNGISFVELEATPTKYYDSYKISEIQYQTGTQIETKEVENKLEAIFYKEIYSYEDWQSIDPESYENYRLMNDLDFRGKSDMKVGLSVNRFISDGSKLKNIDLEMGQKNASIILELKAEMTNVGFENIHITNTGGIGTGIIYNNSGIISNLKLENIKLESEYNYIAPICRSTLGQIEQVEMNYITVKGKDYVAGLVGVQNKNIMQNVTANEIIIEGTGNYIGGIIGKKVENTYTFQNILIQNSNITGNNYVGGIAGEGSGSYFTSQNNTITGNSYVGGVAGNLMDQSQNCINYEIETKHCKIYSSGKNAGGIAGCSNSADQGKFKVEDSLIQGTTVNANNIGGISGLCYWTILKSTVQNSVIQSLGSNVGGIAGEYDGGAIAENFSMNNKIEGYSNVGGICGILKKGDVRANYHNSQVTAIEHSAGGVVGYIENLGMTASVKTCKVQRNYIADSSVKAKSYVGGIVGNIQTDLYTVQDYYNKNFIETELMGKDENTMSLGIGGRPDQNIYFKDTYYYQYSKVNGKNPNEQSEKFIKQEQYLNEKNLKDRTTYSQKLKWGGEFDYTVLDKNKYPIIKNNYYYAEQEGIDLPKDEERKEEIQVSKTKLEEIENEEELLETANYKGNTIDTYSNFTVITAQNGKSVTRKDRIYVKEGKLYVLDGALDMIENNVILDSYNGKEYETVLGTDGKLYDLKESLHYPENFKNENIVSLDNNLHTEYKLTTVTYQDGSKIQFNYQTGEILKEEKVGKKQLGLMEYIKQSLKTRNTLIEETKERYEESQNLLQELKAKSIDIAIQEKEGNIENIANKENTENIENMQASISSSNEKKYITSYNPETEKFDIYAEDELLNTKAEEVISENEKIEKNNLEEYYTNDRSVRKGSGIIWISISIIGILITLGILWKRKNV